ncbi:MAG: hypothetical protein QM790_04125 [Nibricoccus sp.]
MHDLPLGRACHGGDRRSDLEVPHGEAEVVYPGVDVYGGNVRV